MDFSFLSKWTKRVLLIGDADPALLELNPESQTGKVSGFELFWLNGEPVIFRTDVPPTR